MGNSNLPNDKSKLKEGDIEPEESMEQSRQSDAVNDSDGSDAGDDEEHENSSDEQENEDAASEEASEDGSDNGKDSEKEEADSDEEGESDKAKNDCFALEKDYEGESHEKDQHDDSSVDDRDGVKVAESTIGDAIQSKGEGSNEEDNKKLIPQQENEIHEVEAAKHKKSFLSRHNTFEKAQKLKKEVMETVHHKFERHAEFQPEEESADEHKKKGSFFSKHHIHLKHKHDKEAASDPEETEREVLEDKPKGHFFKRHHTSEKLHKMKEDVSTKVHGIEEKIHHSNAEAGANDDSASQISIDSKTGKIKGKKSEKVGQITARFMETARDACSEESQDNSLTGKLARKATDKAVNAGVRVALAGAITTATPVVMAGAALCTVTAAPVLAGLALAAGGTYVAKHGPDMVRGAVGKGVDLYLEKHQERVAARAVSEDSP